MVSPLVRNVVKNATFEIKDGVSKEVFSSRVSNYVNHIEKVFEELKPLAICNELDYISTLIGRYYTDYKLKYYYDIVESSICFKKCLNFEAINAKVPLSYFKDNYHTSGNTFGIKFYN